MQEHLVHHHGGYFASGELYWPTLGMHKDEYLAGWMECRLQICLFQGLNIAIELVISSKDFFWKAPIVAL